MRTVLWQDPSDPGAERCSLETGAGGAVLSGTSLVVSDGSPCELHYAVRLDEDWRTRHVEVARQGPSEAARLVLEADGAGRWLVDGQHQADLDGCLDVDLECSPATNTLPIRRLGLAIGGQADLLAAWVRFPGPGVERAEQRYTRLAEDRYRFAISGFSADLDVDAEGLVVRYGPFWRQVASR